MNFRTEAAFLQEMSHTTLVTPTREIVSSTSGVFVLTRYSPFANQITGTASGFAVELPNPATLSDGWRVELHNTTTFPVVLKSSSDTQIGTIPVGHTVEAVLVDAIAEQWSLLGTAPTSYIPAATTATTADGTLALSATSPPTRFFTGTATGYSVQLPSALTILSGAKYTLVNTSSQTISVKNNGGAVIATLPPASNTEALLQDATTANGTWVFPTGNFTQTTQYQYFEDLTAASTTSTAFSDAAQFNTETATVLGGLYRVAVFFAWTNAVDNSDSRFRLTFNGTQVGPEVRIEKAERNNQSVWESGFALVNGTGAVATVALQFASESSGVTTTVTQARFEIWRVR